MLTANIGLCLFLFLVGLEIDAGIIKRNARLSAMVALAGMVLPFGIGAGLAVPIFNRFIDDDVEFTHFMLFTGVAFSITAFPVLCRILTELKLLDTTVGIVVLSAGVGNDIIGWVLLALSVALVNAGSGLTALYILLVSVGWTLFILFPVKYAMKWFAKVSGSIENGPSVFFMTVTMIVLFGSAFFTDIIGVHAIFGAFLAGLVVPREGGLAISLTEKLEDMVAVIFLPLYFTLSGLSTDLGLLNDGITWAFTIAIIVTAFLGKFGGCTLAARYAARFDWRESMTIGSLMSCKGLVELIVLNVGLAAGILSRRVFSMFVLEALVLTFATTPLVVFFYPPEFRVRIVTANTHQKHHHHGGKGHDIEKPGAPKENREYKTRFTVVLDKFEHLGSIMALVQLVNPPPPPYSEDQLKKRPSIGSVKSNASSTASKELIPPTRIEALRVFELSDRTSAVMKSATAETILHSDPLLSTFRMYGVLNNIDTHPAVAILKFDELAAGVAEHAKDSGSDMILVPWLPPSPGGGVTSNTGVAYVNEKMAASPTPGTATPAVHAEGSAPGTPAARSPTSSNPFEMLFKSTLGGPVVQELPTSVIHSQFVRSVFMHASTDVALFVDQSMISARTASYGNVTFGAGSRQHLFLPFFGGPDDRLALEFLVQIVERDPSLTATVVRITKREKDDMERAEGEKPPLPQMPTISSEMPGDFPDTFYGEQTTQTRLQSDTADNLVWGRFVPSSSVAGDAIQEEDKEDKEESGSDSRSSTSSSSLALSTSIPRIDFKQIDTHAPLHAALQEALKYTANAITTDDTTTTRPDDNGSTDDNKVEDEGSSSGRDDDGVIALEHRQKDAKTTQTAATTQTGNTGRRKLRGPLIVLTGRSRRLAVENHRKELTELMDEFGPIGAEVRKTVGDVATAFAAAGVGNGVVVFQAAVQ
ncbi:potassium:hydrogen antiporter, variant 2 [Coprinopsis cinerea AmutBmut pab1-1]|nr:potassium:hydrogen antiporter, variant 2 [Coprinopsis cinerea AmutBmut pab1-1]